MRDFTEDLRALRLRLAEAEKYLGLERISAEKAELELRASEPGLWDDPEQARQVTSRLAAVSDDVSILTDLASGLSDAETLYELALEEGDESLAGELDDAVRGLNDRLDGLELRSLFIDQYDEGDAIFEVHSGAGGVDAQDWAEMLLRMYRRWAERRGFAVEVDDVAEGNEAGITSATLIVKGRYAYGLLAAERGVHRLVRISPFDAQARRQTSFAGVSVTPFVEDAASEVAIDEKDLRIDVFRSSGAGGQHINTTDSAVRITHLPTGIVVGCQNERSQHQNKARAMQILAAKLVELKRQEHEAHLASVTGPTKDAAWGNQIRSYVLAPYQMVKDLRSGHETGNVQAVLDGDLDAFMESWLRWRRAEAAAPA